MLKQGLYEQVINRILRLEIDSSDDKVFRTGAIDSAAALTKAIISMAHGLDLKVIGEGVENEGQLEYLRFQADLLLHFHLTSHHL